MIPQLKTDLVYYITKVGDEKRNYFIANRLAMQKADDGTSVFSFYSILGEGGLNMQVEKWENERVVVLANGEVYNVQVLTKKIFEEKIMGNLIQQPAKRLTSDLEVQNFFKRLNTYELEPYDSLKRTKERIEGYLKKKD